MESVSLRLYSDAYPCHRRGCLPVSQTGKHPNINVETQIPLELSCHGYVTPALWSLYLWHDYIETEHRLLTNGAMVG